MFPMNPLHAAKAVGHLYAKPANIAANMAERRHGPEYTRPIKGSVLLVQSVAALALAHWANFIPDVGIQSHTEAHPSMHASLTVATTIPSMDCDVYLEGAFDKVKAKVTKKLHSSGGNIISKGINALGNAVPLATWTEEWSGSLGAYACTKDGIDTVPKWISSAPRRDGGHGAYVINIDADKDMELVMFEKKPGAGWKSDTGGIAGGLISALTDEINGYIPFLHAGYVDGQQNGLRTIAMTLAMDQMASTCGPAGIDLLSHPKDLTADAERKQPQSIQGETIKHYVFMGNAMLKGIYQRLWPKDWETWYERDKLTPDDVNVNITVPDQGVALLSNYTNNFNQMAAHAGSDVSFPSRKSYPACSVKQVNQGRYVQPSNPSTTNYAARRSGKK